MRMAEMIPRIDVVRCGAVYGIEGVKAGKRVVKIIEQFLWMLKYFITGFLRNIYSSNKDRGRVPFGVYGKPAGNQNPVFRS